MIDGNLRAIFRQHLPKPRWIWSPVESRTINGIPDSFWCDTESGCSGWLEFKQTPAYAVSVRPHQCSWLTTHARAGVRCAVAVLTTGAGATSGAGSALWLVRGHAASALALGGLQGVSGDAIAGVWLGKPRAWDWNAVAAAMLAE